MTTSPPDLSGGVAFVELIRLAVVVLATAAALEIATQLGDDEGLRLVITGVGAGIGYVVGGVIGRFSQGRIAATERTLQLVPPSEIIAGAAGTGVGLAMAGAVTWPVLLFGGKAFTVPLAVIVLTTSAWVGMRVGRSRAGDLLRFLGAGGRLPASSHASGRGYKLVDSSALIDGRLVDICRDGWVEGVLVVPEFVLHELQGLADSEDPDRRRRGQRGLDSLTALQRLSGVGVEVLEATQGHADVDTALLAIAKQRGTPLVTTDGNLSRVAEIQGIAVRNLHHLAEGLRPPILPGDVLSVRLSKPGREDGQGVGFLDDGTMVVVERAADRLGEQVEVEVTGLMSNNAGRMLFAVWDRRGLERAATSPRAGQDVEGGA